MNRDKCQFKMSHLEFMGHVLSARGIDSADVEVKAVVDKPHSQGSLLPALRSERERDPGKRWSRASQNLGDYKKK